MSPRPTLLRPPHRQLTLTALLNPLPTPPPLQHPLRRPLYPPLLHTLLTHQQTSTSPESGPAIQTRSLPVIIATAPLPHIGLVGHLRIRRTETGEPVPEAPTYTHRIRLHYRHCPRTFTHRMDLVGHMRIHEDEIGCGLDTPSTSCTSTMPSSTHAPPPGTPTVISPDTFSTSWTPTMSSPTHTPSSSSSTINSIITATISATKNDTADFSCRHCRRTFISRIGLVGYLRILAQIPAN
nr:unnamed protein product [Spirometra erinaceieuropaei]